MSSIRPSARFLRSKRERALLWYAADGCCTYCRAPLPPSWHADHVRSWRATHRTHVQEMVALCPRCNLRKGAKMLRTFQHEFLGLVQQIKDRAVPYRDIYCDITPGGGKSSLPLMLQRLLPTYAEKICWVVPRRALAMQAEKSFADETLRALFGSHGVITWSDNTANPSKGTLGFVVTYDSLASDPTLYQHEFERHRYILFLDEPHHMRANPQNEYSKAVDPLIQRAQLRVFASGTWQRGDERPIGHVPYHLGRDGILRLQFPLEQTIIYRRIDAIHDAATVPLFFDGIDAHARWKDAKGEERDVHSFDEALASEVGAMLNVVLETDYARALLRKTVQAWQAHKHAWSPAKLLVVAPKQYVAKDYAQWLWQDFGLHIPVAISDETKLALHHIKNFRDSLAPEHAALITVGMASEGLDVKHLTHLACLTRYRTSPWIYQCFARACRITPGKRAGYIFTPDDPEMKAIIETIKLEQMGQARLPDESPDECNRKPSTAPSHIMPLTSRLTTNRAYDFEESLPEHETARLEAVMQRHGFLGFSVLEFKRAFEDYQSGQEISQTETEKPDLDLTYSEMRLKWRQKIAVYQRQVDRFYWGSQWRSTAIEVNRRFGKSLKEYTNDELEQIWIWLNQRFPLTADEGKE